MLAKFALRNLQRNKRRSLVVVATISFGLTGILFLDSFFTGLLAMHADNAIRSRFGHGQVMEKGYWEAPHAKPWEHWLSGDARMRQDLAAIDGVTGVFPRVSFHALISNGTSSIAGKGIGVEGEREQKFFNKMNFVQGGNLANTEDGLILGVGLARALSVKVGDRVTLIGRTVHGTVNALDLKVKGVFHIGMKEADDMLFQIQLTAAQTLLDSPKVEAYAIGLQDEKFWPNVSSFVSTNYPSLEALDVYQLDQAWALNGKLFLTALMNVFKLTFFGVIILAIYNSASNTVLERRREIGMLRANGESKQDIMALLSFEGLYLAAIGSLLAVLFLGAVYLFGQNGITMPPTPGTNRALPVPLSLDFFNLSVILTIGIGACVGATFVSAWHASKTSIIQSIRSAA